MSGSMPVGLMIAILNRAFRKKLDEKAASMGLTAVQLRVLGSISRLKEKGKEEIHQNDLEQIEHVTHPAMNKILNKLESKGFVRWEVSAYDKRYKNIYCTDKSVGIHKLILLHDDEVYNEICKDLTEGQKKQLLDILRTILSNIDSDTLF